MMHDGPHFHKHWGRVSMVAQRLARRAQMTTSSLHQRTLGQIVGSLELLNVITDVSRDACIGNIQLSQAL